MWSIERVYELAAERNLTINQLAEMSGVGLSTIRTAKRRGCQLSIDTIERICVALEIPLCLFFLEEADAPEVAEYLVRSNLIKNSE